MSDIQDKESAAWAEYRLAKQYSNRRKTSTGILKRMAALEKWEQAADEKFEKDGSTINYSHSQKQESK